MVGAMASFKGNASSDMSQVGQLSQSESESYSPALAVLSQFDQNGLPLQIAQQATAMTAVTGGKLLQPDPNDLLAGVVSGKS